MCTLTVELENRLLHTKDMHFQNSNVYLRTLGVELAIFRHNQFIFVSIRIKETLMKKENSKLYWKYSSCEIKYENDI